MGMFEIILAAILALRAISYDVGVDVRWGEASFSANIQPIAVVGNTGQFSTAEQALDHVRGLVQRGEESFAGQCWKYDSALSYSRSDGGYLIWASDPSAKCVAWANNLSKLGKLPQSSSFEAWRVTQEERDYIRESCGFDRGNTDPSASSATGQFGGSLWYIYQSGRQGPLVPGCAEAVLAAGGSFTQR